MGNSVELGNGSSTEALADSLAAALDGLADALHAIGDGPYADPSLDPVYSSTVGGHVRHILDHARLLERGLAAGTPIDYEARERGGTLERDRRGAVAEARRLAHVCRGFGVADRPCVVRVKPSPGAADVDASTTLARELAFVCSHTIHHQAMIRLLLARSDVRVGAEFGLAHGTPRPAPEAPAACAR